MIGIKESSAAVRTSMRSEPSVPVPFTHFLRRYAAIFFFFLLVSLPGAAQEEAEGRPRLEVFGGYSYLRFESKAIGFAGQSNMNGWNVAASYRLFRSLSVVADVSGHYASEIRVYNFLIGPQIAVPRGKLTYFGRFLYGKSRDQVTPLGGQTSIGRAFVFGGGVDRAITNRWAFRLQADYLSTRTFGADENNLRVSTGLVYRFGR